MDVATGKGDADGHKGLDVLYGESERCIARTKCEPRHTELARISWALPRDNPGPGSTLSLRLVRQVCPGHHTGISVSEMALSPTWLAATDPCSRTSPSRGVLAKLAGSLACVVARFLGRLCCWSNIQQQGGESQARDGRVCLLACSLAASVLSARSPSLSRDRPTKGRAFPFRPASFLSFPLALSPCSDIGTQQAPPRGSLCLVHSRDHV